MEFRRTANLAPYVFKAIDEEGLGSLGFASALIRDCEVAVSPGNGFGPGGEGFVRFALIENEQRIRQAVRRLRRGLDRLQPAASTP